MRSFAALALVVLAVGLLGAGCGSSAGKTSAQTEEADQQWLTGLQAWGRSMRLTLNQMSEVFASPYAVNEIAGADRSVAAKLAGYEGTLAGCSARVRSLGPAPAAYVEARRFALRACSSLEEGARLVRDGVKQFQNGNGSTTLSSSIEPLSDGQSDVELAVSQVGGKAD